MSTETTWYEYQYTDTYGGEANYSWVNRGVVKASDMDQALRKAKKALGLNGTRGRKENYGDEIKFTPRGHCTVLFINWIDHPDIQNYCLANGYKWEA